MMSTSRYLLILGLLTLFALPVLAGDLPQAVEEIGGDAYDWISASRVLTPDGQLKPGLPEMLRDEVEYQLRHAEYVGQGDYVVSREKPHGKGREECDHAVEWRSFGLPRGGAHVPLDSQGLLGSSVLLSEVAVAATLGAGQFGFSSDGHPMILHDLTDIERLRMGSGVPTRVLIQHEMVATHGRVFCSIRDYARPRWEEPPRTGDRIVLLGHSTLDGVFRSGMKWGGSVALVQRDNGLDWGMGPLANGVLVSTDGASIRPAAPARLRTLRAYIDMAVRNDLFRLTEDLVSQPYRSPDRTRFGEAWRTYREAGCHVSGVSRMSDNTWTPRLSCLRRPER